MSYHPDSIGTEGAAYELLESLRWPSGQPEKCPHCASPCKFYFLQTQGGTGTRKTRTGNGSDRRVWKCGACRRQFSVLTGTALHGTRISIRTWVCLIASLCEHPMSTGEIAERFGISRHAAHGMLQRVRLAAETTDDRLHALLAKAEKNHRNPVPGK